jgi:hypothetical protein
MWQLRPKFGHIPEDYNQDFLDCESERCFAFCMAIRHVKICTVTDAALNSIAANTVNRNYNYWISLSEAQSKV